MAETFGATFSATDMVALTRALIDAAPYARGVPTEMRQGLVPTTPTADWRDQMLAEHVDGLSVGWGTGQRIGRNPRAIAADFPAVPLDAQKVLDFVASLPFELAVLPLLQTWADEYFAPAISADHALLGWGMILKGAGHERSVVSRRWLEHGPSRLLRGRHDTTLVQFHDVDADAATSMAQARPGHDWMVAGFLRPKHKYKHDIGGIYTKDDGLMRIVVNDREVTDRELLDACAARRDGRDDPARPIQNIAYAFIDENAAKARLDALWLRELECRAVVKGKEVRLDQHHSVDVARPTWVTAASRSGLGGR